jgi:cytochrome c oxidase subunit III
MSQAIAAEAPGDHGHGAHHDPHLQHHFDTMEQQFDAGKMGTWIFLVTEVLFFSGLFCAYAIFRANHPEIFVYAHHFLDTTMGAINTCVLLFSSLTMAWGVRCAQLGQRNGLVVCLALTLLCAFGFMFIKYKEYSHKFHAGLLWGELYHPDLKELRHAAGVKHVTHDKGPEAGLSTAPQAAVAVADAHAKAEAPAKEGEAAKGEAAKDEHGKEAAHAEGHGHEKLTPAEEKERDELIARAPKHVNLFFSVYFCMTGLHGIHVLAGIGLITWLLIRATKGEFGPTYFAPVDYVGLYWHIVDLVWIYLFPLLYLIH